MDNLLDWFLAVIKGLVSNQDAVSIEKIEDEQGILFIVTVDDGDIGKVIGKQGTIAQALRTVLRSAGYLHDTKVSMKIDVPESKFEVER